MTIPDHIFDVAKASQLIMDTVVESYSDAITQAEEQVFFDQSSNPTENYRNYLKPLPEVKQFFAGGLENSTHDSEKVIVSYGGIRNGANIGAGSPGSVQCSAPNTVQFIIEIVRCAPTNPALKKSGGSGGGLSKLQAPTSNSITIEDSSEHAKILMVDAEMLSEIFKRLQDKVFGFEPFGFYLMNQTLIGVSEFAHYQGSYLVIEFKI